MVDQIGTPVFGCNNRVVPLLPFSKTHMAPTAIGSEDINATSGLGIGTIVHHITGVNSTLVPVVPIRTIGLLRAENTHLVPSLVLLVVVAVLGRQHKAVAHEQIVITVDVLNIGAFARYVIAAGNLLTKIRVAGDTVARTRGGVFHVVVAQAVLLVQLQHPDAATP